ncbi:efflux RND transporter periplasmic adaptor subunit [Maritimibacter alkaliphilus]|uniref:efflux RND transporter periplasmic adaptor subunit n=1 Tax=Maritimibacter alkaliphilus TaxID=404236 RepID=UPI001C985588|nr:efflux RND transporter periplasmic adaptor subunit [Maritimibacter alkaliphilus]MBY6092074.1 efflux RND transporter periplasmic adaptor subunit [Maritimibacter alkaliphilus]
MPKYLKIAIVLLLLGGGGYAVWSQFFKPEPPVQLTTAPVARGTVEETVLASGIIEAQQLISVGARVSGQVETLAVTLGQQVQEGDLIAQIDNQDQQNDVLQAKADLAQIEAQIAANEANLRKAQLLLERAEKLQAQNYTSQVDVESATADVQVYKADLAALAAQKDKAEVTVSTAQIALDRTRITAPITGTVVAIVVNEGQTVNANTDAPTIVKLANLDQMVVKAEISEADVVHVRAGQEVRFTILGEPEQQFTATVRDVEPAPSEIKDSDTISTDEAIYYNGLFDVENPDHTLRIGMTTQVSIVLDRAEGVLTLPAAALKGSARSGYTVQVVDPATGAPRSVAVEVGLNNKVTAQITSGLSEGDRVVTGAAVAAASSTSSSRGGPPPMGF